MVPSPIDLVPINTGTVHIHESPVDAETVRIHKSPIGIGNVHIHGSMKVRVWIPQRSGNLVMQPWIL